MKKTYNVFIEERFSPVAFFFCVHPAHSRGVIVCVWTGLDVECLPLRPLSIDWVRTPSKSHSPANKTPESRRRTDQTSEAQHGCHAGPTPPPLLNGQQKPKTYIYCSFSSFKGGQLTQITKYTTYPARRTTSLFFWGGLRKLIF